MEQNEETQVKISKRKPGRTLLVSNEYKEELNLDGIENIHETSSGSRFLVFNNTDNARDAYESLKDKGVKTKYSYYKVFLRLKDINLDVDYDELKNDLIELSSKLEKVNILYLKFYTKDKKLMGSGDLTVDTKEGLDELVKMKDVEFKDGSVSFYRFKLKPLDDVVVN
jgi:hypothetical protein